MRHESLDSTTQLKRPIRVLYYNWVDYLDSERRGGGVTVYQRNLMNALFDTKGVEPYFVSGGIAYDFLSRRPRWERIRHGARQNRDRRFEIVNSGLLAPAHHSFGSDAQLDHKKTQQVFFDFIARNGPFDIVHFNNLEGLPASVLELGHQFPNTKVVLSLHNYYPICPQVNLWKRETKHCDDFKNGQDCETCIGPQPSPISLRLAHALSYRLKRLGVLPESWLFGRIFGTALSLWRSRRWFRWLMAQPKPASPPDPERFKRRRETMVATINQHVDRVLCVSRRVREIAGRYGIDAVKTKTEYIGSEHARRFAANPNPRPLVGEDGRITICYLGYMRRDKGFFFLLDSLEKLPKKIARRFTIVIAAATADPHTMARVHALSDRFGSLVHHDGYTPDMLDEILEPVTLGIVPVLWEDNLPQVAIEMHARKITLLTSDRGGAQELSGHADWRFTAGSTKALVAKLRWVAESKPDMTSYWRHALIPPTPEQHVETLLRHYQELTAPSHLADAITRP